MGKTSKQYLRAITASIFSLLLLFSCEKEEENVQPSVQATTGTIEGYLIAMAQKQYLPSSNNPTGYVTGYGEGGLAYFYDTLTWSTIDAGIVKCENRTFGKHYSSLDSSTVIYGDTSDSSPFINLPVDWSVTGNKNVPTINVSVGIGLPYISEPLVDTVDISKPFTLTCDTMTNIDSILFTTNWDPNRISQPGTMKSVTYTPADMADMASYVPGYFHVFIHAYRDTIISINGRSYLFRNQYSAIKEIWVK